MCFTCAPTTSRRHIRTVVGNIDGAEDKRSILSVLSKNPLLVDQVSHTSWAVR